MWGLSIYILSSQLMMVVLVQKLYFENFNCQQIVFEIYIPVNKIGLKRIFTERSCNMAFEWHS